MYKVKAMNYTGFNYQCIGEEETKENLRLMQKKTACNTVILVLGALQEQADSTIVNYNHDFMPKDLDLIDFIRYAKQIGLQVFIKPVINCLDGANRSDISFMKKGKFQQSKWKEWFQNYLEFVVHYAKIAEEAKCDLFFVGCQLSKIVYLDEDWRNLIRLIRSCFHGKLTYEANVFCEAEVTFWDCLDLIATSGIYARDKFCCEIERVSSLAAKYKKELYLTECGCMSTERSSLMPDAWYLEGALSLTEQVDYLHTVFQTGRVQKRINGVGIWCWNNRRQTKSRASKDRSYYVYGKPVCEFIHQEWSLEKE